MTETAVTGQKRDAEDAVHPFDEAIALDVVAEGRYVGRMHAAYANMVGPFGGVTAATMLRAVLDDPRRLGEALSLTVNYAGPVADGPFDILATPVRTNRSTQHWTITLTQDDVVTTTATAVFGVRRDTWSSTEVSMPAVPAADEVPVFKVPALVAWTRNYEMRYVEGALPDMDSEPQPDSTTTLWVRDFPARPLDVPALTALCDVFYPRVFRRRGTFVPAGTVSLTTYFHAGVEVVEEQSDQPILATARAADFGGGYFDQSARLWSGNGRLLATSHQLVYFKY
ncbi:acyl-CoA thioesterase [Saccharomonospora viridis]|uniref:Acyl-CoA thioesterase n=1 Tax=Saccharomonospora viridis TaxID=1852 RepID=A0A837DBS2_9PSEU|nr:thioesterase family protein [Saccharomonospora viridis]KHF43814.1 acyl-CoA thioesterase [Saccharomonospora viridis]SFP83440.1 Acyl-CoA thioesterase [Saccharomonospora viridis]